MTVVIPLSFRIVARPVSLSLSMNLSTNDTMTGSLPLGATAGRVSPITGAGTLGPAVGTSVYTIVTPLARASASSFSILGMEATQRGRLSVLQNCLMKSIINSAVVLGSSVTGLSSGGGGGFTLDHSS